METLSWVDFRAGDAELALRDTTEALATFRKFDHVRGITIILNHMARYLVSLTRYGEAEKSAREALYMAREHDLDVLAAYALQHLGAIAALRPQGAADLRHTGYEQAARVLGFVDARLAAMGWRGPKSSRNTTASSTCCAMPWAPVRSANSWRRAPR